MPCLPSHRYLVVKPPGILMQQAITWILKSSFFSHFWLIQKAASATEWKGTSRQQCLLCHLTLPSSPRRPISYAEWGRAPRGKIASNHGTGSRALMHAGAGARSHSLQFAFYFWSLEYSNDIFTSLFPSCSQTLFIIYLTTQGLMMLSCLFISWWEERIEARPKLQTGFY